jgi:hypothetical protein
MPIRPVAVPSPFETDHSYTRQSHLGGPLPASMPLDIAYPANTPSVAVSQYPQHLSSSEQVYHSGASCYPFDFSLEEPPADTPSNSFQSATWTGALQIQHEDRLEEDILSSFTAPSSFDIRSQNLSVVASLSSPQTVSPHVYTHGQLGTLNSPPQVDRFDDEGSYPMSSLPSTSMSGWAQGAYNVSDRTNFGSLAHSPIASPGARKRRASHSRAGSSTGLSCEGCGRVFPSKAERE